MLTLRHSATKLSAHNCGQGVEDPTTTRDDPLRPVDDDDSPGEVEIVSTDTGESTDDTPESPSAAEAVALEPQEATVQKEPGADNETDKVVLQLSMYHCRLIKRVGEAASNSNQALCFTCKLRPM